MREIVGNISLNITTDRDNVIVMKPVEGIRDPWDRVQTIAEQCIRLSTANTPYVPSKVPSFLGWLLARLSNSYYGQESVFVSKAVGRFSQAAESTYGHKISREEIYRLTCYPNRTNAEGRRSPGFAESTIETARRLRDLRLIEEALSKTTVGAVVGGSMSYGKFINVKGGDDASDIDLLVVIDSWNDLADNLANLRELDIISKNDVDRMIGRAENMLSRWGDREDIAFSAKAALRESQEDPFLRDFNVSPRYEVSFHFMSREGADIVLMKDYLDLSISDELKSKIFMDYREVPPTRDDFQRSFSGDSLGIPVEYEEHLGSYERFTASFVVDGGRFYPGMLQDIILPAFDVRWGDTRFRRVVESFRWKLIERLRYEKNAFPNEILRLSFAHTRSDVFASHTIRSVDASTNLA